MNLRTILFPGLLFVITFLSGYASGQGKLLARNDTLLITWSHECDSAYFSGLDTLIHLKQDPFSKLWQGSLPVSKIDSFLCAYQLLSFKNGVKSPGKIYEWEGPAMMKLPKVNHLQGRIEERKLKSHWLSKERKLTVYLPPHYQLYHNYPVIYLTDGKVVNQYAA